MRKRLPNKYSRVIISHISPQVDDGRFAAKRYLHENINFKAALLVDGHEIPKGNILIRHESEKSYQYLPMRFLYNDEWIAEFKPTKLGIYFFKIEAALDRFATWNADLLKRLEADQNVSVDLTIGAAILEGWSSLLDVKQKDDLKVLLKVFNDLENQTDNQKIKQKITEIFSLPEFFNLAEPILDYKSRVETTQEFPIRIEPQLAKFSSWYEFFPRSTTQLNHSEHGTFADAIKRLDYVHELGFNVVYLPPISPIGMAFRKGKNNTLAPTLNDVGSPWAIGDANGGHKAVHSALGSEADFLEFLKAARKKNIEVALDIAFQCSPDHPYVKEHPEWFKKRPDGTIQYAENPPKKYQDIYPFDFECEDWKGLWKELLSVFLYWIKKGVIVFRVDNPHTKPFHFWEWLIFEIKRAHPEVIFLSEAFSRPKIMQQLAKLGFSQSYTYFTWRNSKKELVEYMNELVHSEVSEYFVPNFWPNTPDILPIALQKRSAPIYMQRLVLAATLSSNYGIYGPAYELMEHKAFKVGGEEYLNSEKYEIKKWDLDQADSLSPYIKKINCIRKKHKALQQNQNFRFHSVSNESLLAYSKYTDQECILVVVNLDAENTQAGMVELPLQDWELNETQILEVRDLITGDIYHWSGWRNYVELRPLNPAHIFEVILKKQGEAYDHKRN